MEKSFRIKTNIGSDNVVRVNLRQDIDTFEILSLNINADGGYKSFAANYGVIVGRVVGNGGIGIPNAKISVFIPLSEADQLNPSIVALYPFKTVTDVDADGRRYNLLPATYHDNVHVAVGTFPTAQMVLDNNICLEIYEKYFKLSTVTNNSGDYMITNVPVGTQTLHMDVDISDIGYLSQRPYDLLNKGYEKSMFESSSKFKGGTNLDLLPQIYVQNDNITVYPFWGDETTNEIAITRKDFQLQYDFQPTAVFMGSSFTDQDSNYVSEECAISNKCGEAGQLKASTGMISMMRETLDGSLEEVELGGIDQIDGNGVWCIQVPLNLDYITTNEEGEIVRTNDPSKGIPTRARVRFKIYLSGDEEDASTSHPVTYFVPSNLSNSDEIKIGNINYKLGTECPEISAENFETLVNKLTYWGNDPTIADKDFKELCMRDILWNCVYSVKNYIPRLQIVAGDENLDEARGYNHIGIKGVNKSNASDMNPLPYNKMNLGLTYGVWSGIQSIWGSWNSWYNWRSGWPTIFSWSGSYLWQSSSWTGRYFRFFGYSRPFVYNYKTYENVASEDEILGQTLQDEDGISFDFYNDWLNGSMYFPKVKFDANDNDNICACNKEITKNNFFLNDSCSLDYSSNSTVDLSYATNRCITGYTIFGDNDDGKIDGIDWHAVEESGNGINNFNTHTGNVQLKNGFIYRNVSENDPNNVTYAYSPILLGRIENGENNTTNPLKLFPGFRTDLILLGSIDNYNVLGIPNVRNMKLPKTTSTIVPIYRAEVPFNPSVNHSSSQTLEPHGSYHERIDGQEAAIGDDKTGDQEGREVNFSRLVGLFGGRSYYLNGAFWGTAEYTPWYVYTYRWYRYWGGWWSRWWASWGARPILISPQTFFTDRTSNNYNERDMGIHTLLGQGLFFGRTAFTFFSNMYVTKPKSCINLSRICELSVVNEDSLAYLGNSYGSWVNADTIGVITDDQITVPLGRTLFATLNKNELNVVSGDTSLPRYGLEYTPIDGFDGFLNGMILKEGKITSGNKVQTTLSETRSQEYIDFKYGKSPKFNYYYIVDSAFFGGQTVKQAVYRVPITDNSFYFYFGINASYTAIDKFNEYFS